MVKVVNIPEIPQRFINYERLHAIKSRVQRLPVGRYEVAEGVLQCVIQDDAGMDTNQRIIIGRIDHIGLDDLLINLKSDLDALINHVENADMENDVLLEKLSNLEV